MEIQQLLTTPYTNITVEGTQSTSIQIPLLLKKRNAHKLQVLKDIYIIEYELSILIHLKKSPEVLYKATTLAMQEIGIRFMARKKNENDNSSVE